jgi:hypothetical protein
LVSWSSRKQSSVAQSTTEAEYVAAASCCSQLLWISYTLRDFAKECTQIPLLCDSTSAISVAKNPVLHSRTKHIEVRYHFLRDCGERDHCVEPCPYPRSACRHFHKASRPSYICALAGGTWGLLSFLVDSWGISFLYHMYHTMFYFDVYTCFAWCINHGRIAILSYIMLHVYHIAF